MGVVVATAESCTGGLLIGCLTEIFEPSNMVGMPMDLVVKHGTVSKPAARAIAGLVASGGGTQKKP